MTVHLTPKEFCILAILHHSDDALNLKSRLKLLLYLSDKELEDKFTIYSYKKGVVGPEPKGMQRDIDSLEDKNVIIVTQSYTVGGNTRYSYEIEYDSINLFQNILKNNGEDIKILSNIIKNTCEEYGDIPISNLINIVQKEYPKYYQNNFHLYQ